MAPKPSNGGSGIRFKTRAETCKKARKARPGQIPLDVTGAKRNNRPSRMASSRFEAGPASGTALTQPRLRKRQVSMYTAPPGRPIPPRTRRSEEHTSELQSPTNLVCGLLLEKKKSLQWHGRRLLQWRLGSTAYRGGQ